MEGFKKHCKVFDGWYRKSLSHKNRVWHRVVSVDPDTFGKQIANTVCGRIIETTKCDFNVKPSHKCIRCEKSPGVVIEMDRGFAPIGSKSILTRTSAIAELKRLLKPHIYFFRIFGDQGIRIIAEWVSDTGIDIYTQDKIITKKQKKNIMTLHEIQAELGRFKSAIACLLDAITVLATADKKKRKLKGRLTSDEDQDYFEGIMYDVFIQKHTI